MTLDRHDTGRWFADPQEETVGALLGQLRRARGRSQQQLAQLLCDATETSTVTRQEISRWERGTRIPSAQWIRWLAAVLEVQPERLDTAAASTRGIRSARSTRGTRKPRSTRNTQHRMRPTPPRPASV